MLTCIAAIMRAAYGDTDGQGVRSLLFDCYLEIDNHTKKAVNEKGPQYNAFYLE